MTHISTKKALITTAAAAITALGLASCELETSSNGHLDGYWHMVSVDTLATGGTCDMSEKRMFWAVQAKLLQLFNRDNALAPSFFMRFDHGDGTLRLYAPYEDKRSEGDIEVTEPTPLRPFGISATDETFKVEQLSGSHMVLTGATLRLSFRKM